MQYKSLVTLWFVVLSFILIMPLCLLDSLSFKINSLAFGYSYYMEHRRIVPLWLIENEVDIGNDILYHINYYWTFQLYTNALVKIY